MKVIVYNPSFRDQWNNFLNEVNNATFLFNRSFLEYHQDRFQDYSLMVFDEEGKLTALVPSNRTKQNEVISHQGLTYGNIVVKPNSKLNTIIAIASSILRYLYEQKIEHFILKAFPSFYNLQPTDELEYVLFLLNAELYRRDVAMVIDLQQRIPYSGNIRREGKKAEKLAAQIKEVESLQEFWMDVLSPNLMSRFGVKPVHTVEEIELLKARFPGKIRQFNVYLNEKLAAGTTLFVDNGVVHCQYISSTEEGRRSGALNYLFIHLIDSVFKGYKYFDFGIVNENNGLQINRGMLFWKESFGGRAQKHDFYKIRTANYKLLESYI